MDQLDDVEIDALARWRICSPSLGKNFSSYGVPAFSSALAGIVSSSGRRFGSSLLICAGHCGRLDRECRPVSGCPHAPAAPPRQVAEDDRAVAGHCRFIRSPRRRWPKDLRRYSDKAGQARLKISSTSA
jgi:hypothetical protein